MLPVKQRLKLYPSAIRDGWIFVDLQRPEPWPVVSLLARPRRSYGRRRAHRSP